MLLFAPQDDILEIQTSKDVEVDEWKVEVIRLKSKLRQISAEKSIADIYDSFEDDLKRLTAPSSFSFRSKILHVSFLQTRKRK